MHNPDPRKLMSVVAQMPRETTYTAVLERVQRTMGTEPHRSPSAGAIYHALIECGYTTSGRGEYRRKL